MNMKTNAKKAASASSAQPLVKTIGCAFCWARHILAFTRVCGRPNPVLIVL
jgi:sporulation killing factor